MAHQRSPFGIKIDDRLYPTGVECYANAFVEKYVTTAAAIIAISNAMTRIGNVFFPTVLLIVRFGTEPASQTVAIIESVPRERSTAPPRSLIPEQNESKF